jgi:hypothetical protein
MTRRNRLTALAGFVGAVAVLGVLVSVVGVGRIGETLAAADRSRLLLAVGLGAGWLTLWGLLLYVVLRALHVPVSRPVSVLLYVAATFANTVTPFGPAGGEPITALVISKVTASEYRTSLASIASVDALNVVSSLSLTLVGLVYYASTATLGPELRVLALATGVSALALPTGWYLAWHRRRALAGVVAGGLTGVAGVVGRVVPWVEADEATIRAGVDGFVADIERLGENPRNLQVGFGLSALGWVCQAAILFTAFAALGYSVEPAPLLFVVPLANVAGLAPLPGGIGSIESAFVGLLVLVTGFSAPIAAAAVLIHRMIVSLLPTAVGASITLSIGGQRLSDLF